eukprot:853119-Prymnesium_polylepis.1
MLTPRRLDAARRDGAGDHAALRSAAVEGHVGGAPMAGSCRPWLALRRVEGAPLGPRHGRRAQVQERSDAVRAGSAGPLLHARPRAVRTRDAACVRGQ